MVMHSILLLHLPDFTTYRLGSSSLSTVHRSTRALASRLTISSKNITIMSNADATPKGECVATVPPSSKWKRPHHMDIGAQFSNDSLDSFQLAYLERTSKLNWVNGQRKSLFLSYAAGIAFASVLCSPLERIKSVIQYRACDVKQRQRVLPTVVEIYRSGGCRSFFRGLQMTLACRVPSDATFFLMHENLSEYLKVKGLSVSSASLCSSMASGLTSACLFSHFFRVHKIISGSVPDAPSALGLTQQIIRTEGFFGLFKSAPASILGIPTIVLALTLRDTASERLREHRKEDKLPVGPQTIVDLGTRQAASLLTYPQQILLARVSRVDGMRVSLVSAARKSVAQRGVLALWEGASPAVLQSSVNFALAMVFARLASERLTSSTACKSVL